MIFYVACNFSKIGRIEDGVFSERRSTSRFSNEKIKWRKVDSRARIAGSGRVTVIFGTFVGSGFLVSVKREHLAGGGGVCAGRSGRG
jgi:hypothetical protein